MNPIAAEIVELSAIKAAYCHYLASHHAALHVENATMVQQNQQVVCKSIAELKQMVHHEKHPRTPKPATLHAVDYKYSELETNAIFHFNNNKQYIITE